MDVLKLTPKHRQFLRAIKGKGEIESVKKLCEEIGLDFNFVKGFIKSGLIQDWIDFEEMTKVTYALTKLGSNSEYVVGYRLLEKLDEGVANIHSLQESLGNKTLAEDYAKLKKEGVVAEEGSTFVLKKNLSQEYKRRQEAFSLIKGGKLEAIVGDNVIRWLVANSFVCEKKQSDCRVREKPALKELNLPEPITRLTSEMLSSESWKNTEFKPYNIEDNVPNLNFGKPTILSIFSEKIRQIFLDLGFDEMEGKIIESSFWNFDALFTPQDHPAREIQDTFYVLNPDKLPLPEKDIVNKVKKVHEESYEYTWSEDIAKRSILRTHTTSSTARRLYAMKGVNSKLFSIDKVFRNETTDATHLAEFHQIEGVAVGENYTLQDLASYLIYFYERLGFRDIKFKPTYNPYTEPSLEVLAKHPLKNKIVEVGNSGIFRPEVLGPLGYEGRTAIAWGLGLERIAMICSNTPQISDLIGSQIKIEK